MLADVGLFLSLFPGMFLAGVQYVCSVVLPQTPEAPMADDCELITLVGEIDMTRTVELRNVMVAFRESASVHALVVRG